MTIELTHPDTGASTTVATEKAAAIHERSGWVRTAIKATSGPERPADNAPGRKWLAYAAELGHQVDETQFESMEELIAHIDGLGAAPAPEVPADESVITEPAPQEPLPGGRRPRRGQEPEPTTDPATAGDSTVIPSQED